jgi:hypothetical protein
LDSSRTNPQEISDPHTISDRPQIISDPVMLLLVEVKGKNRKINIECIPADLAAFTDEVWSKIGAPKPGKKKQSCDWEWFDDDFGAWAVLDAVPDLTKLRMRVSLKSKKGRVQVNSACDGDSVIDIVPTTKKRMLANDKQQVQTNSKPAQSSDNRLQRHDVIDVLFSGNGPFGMDVNGEGLDTKISFVVEGGLAEQLGIVTGSTLLCIGDVEVRLLSHSEIISVLGSAARPCILRLLVPPKRARSKKLFTASNMLYLVYFIVVSGWTLNVLFVQGAYKSYISPLITKHITAAGS